MKHIGLPLIITPGDPLGIGPEIVKAALSSKKTLSLKTKYIIISGSKPFNKFKFSKNIEFISAPNGTPGFQSGWCIEKAVSLIFSEQGRALITGPISKENLQKGGYLFQGHTDFLAFLTKKYFKLDCHETMMLSNSRLSVALVTTHIPLKEVSGGVTVEQILSTVFNTVTFLTNGMQISNPKIAILALNPHAGENGILGKEEITTVAVATELCKQKFPHCTFTGPHPSDTFFALYINSKKSSQADAVIALYHDQGLIPVKMIDFEHTINITLGLPFCRTSVDHGTAFDIVGKNIAKPTSLIDAILFAHKWSKNYKIKL